MAEGTTKTPYGRLADGTPVDLFTLTNPRGLTCRVITYGAIITELHVPGSDGRMADVVLGFDGLGPYVSENPFFGCVVGRFANRIAKGRFTLDGRTYTLARNNGENCLHGGLRGFDKAVWTAAAAESVDGQSIVFTHVSPDGEEGFPGTVNVRMTYTLTRADELRIDYTATADKATPLNLTNHSYFNLAGKGDVLGQVLELRARRYTPFDPAQIPTGVIAEVAGGPLDFTQPKPIGRDIGRVPGGYDHNFVIDEGGRGIVLAARALDPGSGRTMEILTDQPGVQLYTANGLRATGKGGASYGPHSAFCLETQHYPDSVNQPSFPSTILRPGATFRSTTVHRFRAA
jgi:aldose 1-epimerase